MTVNSRAVSVATTATRLDTSDVTPSSQGLSVYNAGAATVYLGGAGVTTSTGYPVAAGEHLSADLGQSDALYGIVAADTVAVRVLEVGI